MHRCRRKKKKHYADFLIDTSDGFEDTRRQTIEVFEKLELLNLEQKLSTDGHR